MPGMWAKLLFTYGPYGLLVFFVFAAVWVRNSIKDEAGIQCCLIGMAPTSDFRSPFEDLYMRRVYEAKTQSDFQWRIIFNRKSHQERLSISTSTKALPSTTTSKSTDSRYRM